MITNREQRDRLDRIADTLDGLLGLPEGSIMPDGDRGIFLTPRQANRVIDALRKAAR